MYRTMVVVDELSRWSHGLARIWQELKKYFFFTRNSTTNDEIHLTQSKNERLETITLIEGDWTFVDKI